MAKTMPVMGTLSADEITAQIIDAASRERREKQRTIDALVAALEKYEVFMKSLRYDRDREWLAAEARDAGTAALALARGEG